MNLPVPKEKRKKRKEKTRQKSSVSASKVPTSEKSDEESVYEIIWKLGIGGAPRPYLEKETGLNGQLDDALDPLFDKGMIVMVAGQTENEDTFVASEHFEEV